jgi:hypothetical protein
MMMKEEEKRKWGGPFTCTYGDRCRRSKTAVKIKVKNG